MRSCCCTCSARRRRCARPSSPGRQHELQPLDRATRCTCRTAPRCAWAGSATRATRRPSLAVSYNSLDGYAASLQDALTRPYPAYEAIGIRNPGGDYNQLATSLLQIENEFYGTIRPKRVIFPGERPLHALRERGVEYVEVRCMDLDPFEPVGIDAADDALPRRLPAALPADRQPARHARRDRRARRATSTAPPRAAASRACGSSAAATSALLTDWGGELLDACAPIAAALDAAHGGQRLRATRCGAARRGAAAARRRCRRRACCERWRSDFDGSFVGFVRAQSLQTGASCWRCRSAPTQQARFAAHGASSRSRSSRRSRPPTRCRSRSTARPTSTSAVSASEDRPRPERAWCSTRTGRRSARAQAEQFERQPVHRRRRIGQIVQHVHVIAPGHRPRRPTPRRAPARRRSSAPGAGTPRSRRRRRRVTRRPGGAGISAGLSRRADAGVEPQVRGEERRVPQRLELVEAGDRQRGLDQIGRQVGRHRGASRTHSSIVARWPPAEWPATTMRDGSPPCSRGMPMDPGERLHHLQHDVLDRHRRAQARSPAARPSRRRRRTAARRSSGRACRARASSRRGCRRAPARRCACGAKTSSARSERRRRRRSTRRRDGARARPPSRMPSARGWPGARGCGRGCCTARRARRATAGAGAPASIGLSLSPGPACRAASRQRCPAAGGRSTRHRAAPRRSARRPSTARCARPRGRAGPRCPSGSCRARCRRPPTARGAGGRARRAAASARSGAMRVLRGCARGGRAGRALPRAGRRARAPTARAPAAPRRAAAARTP